MKKFALFLVVFIVLFYGAWISARSRTWQAFGEIVPRVETNEKVVALTFDDGPRDRRVDEILNTLAQRRVRATFFVIGRDSQEDPAALRKLVASGHELGNHSLLHVRMWLKSQAFCREQFEKTDRILRHAGYRGPIHVRAPYCKKLLGLPWYFAKTSRTHITFDVEPESDPELDADARKMVAHVLEQTRPGSIILLHPWYENRATARAAIGPIVDGLLARGYRFVTVDELLRMRSPRSSAARRWSAPAVWHRQSCLCRPLLHPQPRSTDRIVCATHACCSPPLR